MGRYRHRLMGAGSNRAVVCAGISQVGLQPARFWRWQRENGTFPWWLKAYSRSFLVFLCKRGERFEIRDVRPCVPEQSEQQMLTGYFRILHGGTGDVSLRGVAAAAHHRHGVILRDDVFIIPPAYRGRSGRFCHTVGPDWYAVVSQWSLGTYSAFAIRSRTRRRNIPAAQSGEWIFSAALRVVVRTGTRNSHR